MSSETNMATSVIGSMITETEWMAMTFTGQSLTLHACPLPTTVFNCVPHECAIKKGQYLEDIYIIISFQRDCIVAKMISLELTKFH